MIDMLDPKEGETIYDPACGTGGMLLAAVQHVRETHGDVKRLWGKLYGQEKNLTTSSIARMNLFLHGIEDFQIVRGDTLRNPAFFEGDRLATFDCVIANPPFSLEKWGEDVWLNDPFGRNFAGLPPSSTATSPGCSTWSSRWRDVRAAWPSCCPKARCSARVRKASIRQKLLEMDLVEAVIGLAPNLFYGTGLAACILVLRKRKPARREEEGADRRCRQRLFRRGRAQNYWSPSTRTRSSLGIGSSTMCRSSANGRPRRDQGRGLDAEHLALRRCRRSQKDIPPLRRGHRGVQGGADPLPRGREVA